MELTDDLKALFIETAEQLARLGAPDVHGESREPVG